MEQATREPVRAPNCPNYNRKSVRNRSPSEFDRGLPGSSHTSKAKLHAHEPLQDRTNNNMKREERPMNIIRSESMKGWDLIEQKGGIINNYWDEHTTGNYEQMELHKANWEQERRNYDN